MSNRHLIILMVSLLLFVPSLWAGFVLDDFYYLGAIEGRFPGHNTKRSLFTFFINDEDATRIIAREGGYPWWIDESIRGETFRPLSDLLLRADYSLHGKNAFGYHLHSLAWWAAALLACGLLFRRALPGAVGVFAFLVFAIDEVHIMPVAWISNRNALVALAPMMFGLWAWIRWCEDGWRAGRFLAPLGIVIGMAGSALSLIPVAAVFPSDRMLLVPGIGLTAALATVLVQAFRSRRVRKLWLLTGAGGFFAIVHLLLAPPLTVYIQSVLVKHSRQSLELAASPVVAEAGGKETILIFAPDPVVGIYLPLMIDHLEGPGPKSWRPLSIAPHDHVLKRSGPRTLELEVAEGGVMLRSIFEELYRDPDKPLVPGTIVDRGLLQAEILAANDRGPTRVAFHFDRDLSDPALYFLVWQEGELRVADLPEIGEEVLLKQTLGPGGF